MKNYLKNKIRRTLNGFTLLEILLVVAILAVIAGVSQDFFGSFSVGANLNNNTQTIVFDLRAARNRAMNGESGRNWGLYLVNNADDYYEIFSSPTDYTDPDKTVETVNFLKDQANFILPAEGSSQEILFNRISGATAAQDIIVSVGQEQRTVSVREQGLID